MSQSPFERFRDRIEHLRSPDGCPWDREQTHRSIAKNMIEEAHEAVAAIEAGDVAGMREELGDVLLQVVLQSRIAEDVGEFTLDDVIDDIDAKIVRRHPHVWGGARTGDPAEVLRLWEQTKLAEKAEAAERGEVVGLLDGIPRSLPALQQAQGISKKAVAAGFEWDSVGDVWEKFAEEVAEFEAADSGSEEALLEFGDVLFTLVNVARKHRIDAETALRLTCDKFRNRWSMMEAMAAEDGRRIDVLSIDEQETLWERAKETEQSR